MAGQHLIFHSFSYASGECQNLGKARNTMFFRSCISGLGSAGISLVPPGVHLRITVSKYGLLGKLLGNGARFIFGLFVLLHNVHWN